MKTTITKMTVGSQPVQDVSREEFARELLQLRKNGYRLLRYKNGRVYEPTNEHDTRRLFSLAWI